VQILDPLRSPSHPCSSGHGRLQISAACDPARGFITRGHVKSLDKMEPELSWLILSFPVFRSTLLFPFPFSTRLR
jgi:hypothetical protein